MSSTDLIMAAAGTSGAPAVYVEDVFSTYLYTGNGSTQTITNGIDLAGKGGLTWIKLRSFSGSHVIVDTARGATNCLASNNTGGNQVNSASVTAFNSNGFSLGSFGNSNASSQTFASWTFRESPKFFDVVTYTGNATNRTIAHNLGSVPGMMIVKCTSSALPGGSNANWVVYNRGIESTLGANDAEYYFMLLNSTASYNAGANRWSNTKPTSTVFTVGTSAEVNASGETYVAYLFAHDAGGFGAAGTDNVISCGSVTTNTSGKADITLGYEPQFLLIKRIDGTGEWYMFDNMRGIATGGQDFALLSNRSDAEGTLTDGVNLTATGFSINDIGPLASPTYIYMAIRRPMKPPTSGTQVFYAGTGNGSTTIPAYVTNFPVDAGITTIRRTTGFTNKMFSARLVSPFYGAPNTTAEYSLENDIAYDSSIGFMKGSWGGANGFTEAFSWAFRRATGFFDVVCYTGTGVARTVAHNLGVAPELMIVKSRSVVGDWPVYALPLGSGTSKYLYLNGIAATLTTTNFWGTAQPTSSVFSVANDGFGNNDIGTTYVAYLFASLAGVSKVGSYTGNGSSQTINCSFTAGARFVMIKRTDLTGDWYVWDTARGIIAGNDPHLSLNTEAAEVTTNDSVDPVASGFAVNQLAATNINVTSATYIYLAIA